jgi:hypothetical protein
MDYIEWKIDILATKNERGETDCSLQISSLVRWVKLNYRILFQENVFTLKEALFNMGSLPLPQSALTYCSYVICLRRWPSFSLRHMMPSGHAYTTQISALQMTGCCLGEKFFTHELIIKSASATARAHSSWSWFIFRKSLGTFLHNSFTKRANTKST